jgi:hypothetical protein
LQLCPPGRFASLPVVTLSEADVLFFIFRLNEKNIGKANGAAADGVVGEARLPPQAEN